MRGALCMIDFSEREIMLLVGGRYQVIPSTFRVALQIHYEWAHQSRRLLSVTVSLLEGGCLLLDS